MTTFKIIRVYPDEIAFEAGDDVRLRGFWWSWCPGEAYVGVYGSTCVEFLAIELDHDPLDAHELARQLAEHYRKPASYDTLISAWFRRLCAVPSELAEVIEDEQHRRLHGS